MAAGAPIGLIVGRHRIPSSAQASAKPSATDPSHRWCCALRIAQPASDAATAAADFGEGAELDPSKSVAHQYIAMSVTSGTGCPSWSSGVNRALFTAAKQVVSKIAEPVERVMPGLRAVPSEPTVVCTT